MSELMETVPAEAESVVTIEDAVRCARELGRQGWDLMAYIQRLAAGHFTCSRRNPWDTPARAFARGQGYCQPQALAF